MTVCSGTKRVPAAERLKLTEGLFTPLYTNCTDGPVGLHGRYIWIRLDIIMLDRQPVRLSRIKLLLKSESMMEYLPEVYRSGDGENGFMTRYLSIFDSIFFDMDGRIDKARSAMDYRAAEGAMLRYLADWIMAEDSAYLDEESLRQRISPYGVGLPYVRHPAGIIRLDTAGIRCDAEHYRVF